MVLERETVHPRAYLRAQVYGRGHGCRLLHERGASQTYALSGSGVTSRAEPESLPGSSEAGHVDYALTNVLIVLVVVLVVREMEVVV